VKTVWRFCPCMDNANTKMKKCLGSTSTYNNQVAAFRGVHVSIRIENERIHWSNPTIPSILSSTTSARMSNWPFFINLIVTVTLDEATDLWIIIYGYPATNYFISRGLFFSPHSLELPIDALVTQAKRRDGQKTLGLAQRL
jgi:hypothetical protein